MKNQKLLDCFICGLWIKPNKDGGYKCPKCKAKWKKDKDGNIIRIYNNYEEYVND